VVIVGRAKDLVISGGYNVYPKEVETCIDELDGIGESAVIGVPHADFGEAVVAVVTRAGDGNAVPEQTDVIAALKTQLAAYKVPKAVVFVDEIPRNVMGKVEKGKLREAYQGILASAAT
jgi:malonyl-CoA/methylmalonyl-CoA synthetase